MQIAICDDEIGTCSEIENMILEFARINAFRINTEVFYSGERLYSAMKEKKNYDLIFLDIQLMKMDGIQAGKLIREQLGNEKINIVYISSKESYAMNLFQVRPLDFLIKPIGEKNIKEIMEKFIRLSQINKKIFTYSIGKSICRVHFEEILYFACNGKKIEIHTISGIQEFYGGMKEAQKQTEGNGFWVIHKSYIVNASFVSKYHYDSVQMTDGNVLPISQRYRKPMKDNLMGVYRWG